MPLLEILREKECVAGIWKTDESPEELSRLLPDPGMYEADLAALKSPGRQTERLAVRVLLYRLLGQQKQILYRPDGSPYLKDGSWDISFSHTPGYAAVIAGKIPGIGIDIEQYSERVRRVTCRFMRGDEPVSSYRGTELWSLLLHWSAKETMFKALRCQGVDFREHLQIEPFTPGQAGTFFAQEYKTPSHRRFAVNYLIRPGFVVTWTCGYSPLPAGT